GAGSSHRETVLVQRDRNRLIVRIADDKFGRDFHSELRVGCHGFRLSLLTRLRHWLASLRRTRVMYWASAADSLERRSVKNVERENLTLGHFSRTMFLCS